MTLPICPPRARRAAAALVLLAGAAPAGFAAADANGLYQAALAATCANCHGTNGHPVSQAAVPGLAGMPANYFAEQMRAFRGGSRPATVMHQIAKGFNDAQIETLAAYFAAQPR